jgi:hypothetical protein
MLHVLGAEPHALIEAREVPLQGLDGSRREIPRREDESKAGGVQAHGSPALAGSLELARLSRPLLADAIEQPVSVRRL